MEKSSLSPDSLSFDVLGEQQKPKDDAVKNKKKNEILKEKGLHKDKTRSNLTIFGSDYFFNYELSWLKFNERVLAEAKNKKNQLFERIKFIGIVCSNLDEYFQKRVGGLKRQLHASVKSLSVDGMSVANQLEAIRAVVKTMILNTSKKLIDFEKTAQQNNFRLQTCESDSSFDYIAGIVVFT